MSDDYLISSVRPGLYGGGIAFGKSVNSSSITRIIIHAHKSGLHRLPLKGELWNILGRWVKHSEFGNQLHVLKGSPTLPENGQQEKDLLHSEILNKPLQLPLYLTNLFTKHPSFKGIGAGKKRLEQAIHRVGSARQFIRELENNNLRALIDAFSNSKRAVLFLHAYAEIHQEVASIKWLHNVGYKPKVANKLLKLLGNNAKQELLKNPYLPLRFGGNFIYTTWDIAEKLRLESEVNILIDSPQRLIGAIDKIAYTTLLDGHTAIDPEDLHLDLEELIGLDLIHIAVETALTARALCKNGNNYQSTGIAYLESYCEQYLQKLIKNKRKDRIDEVALDRAIHKFSDSFKQRTNYELTTGQTKLIHNVFTNNLSIVQGEGGTGKSSALAGIKKIGNHLNTPVYFVALAGVAKDRIEKELKKNNVLNVKLSGVFATPIEEVCTFTLRGFINAIKTTIEEKDKNAILKLKSNPIIIFDESSMIDISAITEVLHLLHHILCTLCFVGDIAQLPPIGFGVFFQKLVEEAKEYKRIAYTELSEVHRQQSTNPLMKISQSIRVIGHSTEAIDSYSQSVAKCEHLVIPKYNQESSTGVYFIETENQNILDYAFDVSQLLGQTSCQIITAFSRRDIPSSTHKINEYFTEKLSTDQLSWNDNFHIDAPIIVTKNIASRKIFNGNIGKIVDLKDSSKILVCVIDGVQHEMDEGLAFDCGLQLAYGVSIHKTQGSEFENTIVLLPHFKKHNDFIENSMLYTAITRSKNSTIFIGSRKTFSNAVQTQPRYKSINIGFSLENGSEDI